MRLVFPSSHCNCSLHKFIASVNCICALRLPAASAHCICPPHLLTASARRICSLHLILASAHSICSYIAVFLFNNMLIEILVWFSATVEQQLLLICFNLIVDSVPQTGKKGVCIESYISKASNTSYTNCVSSFYVYYLHLL